MGNSPLTFRPGAAVSSFKRLLGKRFSRVFEREFAQGVKDNQPYKVVEENVQLHVEVKTTNDGAATNVGVEQLTAAVLAKLKEMAEAYLGHRVEAAILTLPLQFSDDASRSAAVYAGRLAGFKAVRVALSEPVAAVVAYGVSRNLNDEGNVAVLHVGGGTAEASVLTFVDGVYEALSSQYEPFFGGQDFDRRIVDHFVLLVRDKHGKDIADDSAALEKLRTACERAKKTLSHQDHAQVTVESLVDGVDLSELLTRAEFEELNKDLFLKVVEMVDRVVSRLKWRPLMRSFLLVEAP
ncbi:heat shock 70 kDa protein BIP2-like [Miscanthus floridulus]|uniref:heat shock 70 kDa protein BIP2-like n=1 Tax=Miscanthus floridulus TaxID=154761 RepID=UPI00345AB835